MEKCYDYFDCNKIECIMFQNKDDQPCWDVKDTLCFFQPLTPITETSNVNEKCNFCLYKDTYYQKYEQLNKK